MILEPIRIQGRVLESEDIEQIRRVLLEYETKGRTAASVRLCELWGWRDGVGRLKDMACRTMLLKLEARGLVRLPSRRIETGGAHHQVAGTVEHDRSPIDCQLAQLQPIRLVDASECAEYLGLFRCLIATYHYLGLRDVGRNMKYLALSADGRVLACLLFGSAAWKTSARDQFIGWDGAVRERNLHLVANNTRFLIVPWVKVANLASFVLARAAERLRRDWPVRYGYSLAMAETFVDCSRFGGACYRAANWIRVGQTTGRSRQDRYGLLSVPVKDVYIYPLRKDYRQCLCK
jgi:hypothetical protein